MSGALQGEQVDIAFSPSNYIPPGTSERINSTPEMIRRVMEGF